MKQIVKSQAPPHPKVGINPESAFSVYCADAKGRLVFAIEIDDAPSRVYLNPRPTENGRVVELNDDAARMRVKKAISNVKAYFESQGLSVEVD